MRISKSIHYCHLLLGLFQHAQRCNPSCIIQEQLTVSVYQITIDENNNADQKYLCTSYFALGVISKKVRNFLFSERSEGTFWKRKGPK